MRIAYEVHGDNKQQIHTKAKEIAEAFGNVDSIKATPSCYNALGYPLYWTAQVTPS